MDKRAVAAAWKRGMEIAGERGTLRRVAQSGTAQEATVWARQIKVPLSDAEKEMTGASFSTTRRFLILSESLAGWPVPVKRGDLLIVNGRTMAVQVVDDVTRRMQGMQMAVEVEVSGA